MEGHKPQNSAPTVESTPVPPPAVLEELRTYAGVGEAASAEDVAQAAKERATQQGVDTVDLLPSNLSREEDAETMRWLDSK